MTERKNTLLLFILVALAAVGVIIFAVRTFGANRNLSAATPDYDAERKKYYLLVEEVKQMLDKGEDIVLVDVRDESEYTEEHIANSQNIPYAEIENKFVLLPQTKLIITIDDGGDCHQSLGAASKLRKLGFSSVKYLGSGIPAWKEAGYELAQGPPEPNPLTVARLLPADLEKRISEGTVLTLIDLRDEDKFIAGHLPGARHVPYGLVKDQFNKKEIPAEQEIILYDETDLRSVIMAKELLKMGANDVKILEGGISAWTAAGQALET